MKLRSTVFTLLLAFLASGVSAQQPGTIAVGGYGSLTFHDGDLGFTDVPTPGAGAYLSIFFLPNLAAEGDISWVWSSLANSDNDVTYRPIRGRLLWAIPASRNVYPLIGAGYTRAEYRQNLDVVDDAVEVMVGLKAYVSDRFAFRVDVAGDYVWDASEDWSRFLNDEIDDHLSFTLRAGLSLDIGRGRFLDDDGDGVEDRHDACPNTPMGVSVDAAGCRLDTDGDGVFNEDDECGNTPAGVRVDAQGCRIDTDGDGVFDEEDRCANTPSGVTVDNNGCPLDTDGDGVLDYQDECANTPAGVQVDAQGCRIRTDTDGDGIFDDVDRCPNTGAGVQVDGVGCPILFEAEATEIILEGVTFETSSATLTPNSRTILNRVAESLLGNPDVRVRVVGHTDSTGPLQFNMDLSQQRAESVVEYLQSRGVPASQLEALGVGPEDPVAPNDTAEGRQQNRRVELQRIGN
ncbi:MAG TPA: OmpA family protein [Longimicrobiales bacterium]|nr:OmpA family protein [Longimicrobiales bacterium]